MDLAAPGGNKEGTFCARCFAPVEKGEAYCPDCGAPTGEAAPGADSAVHRELAQANLLRLRGDLDGSEKALLAILRRFPNDPHAHEMLGDVCDERGEGERAKEWYELALDLAPGSPEVRRKLQETGARNEARATADTAEVLGLPSPTPAAQWWPLALAGALLILAIAVAAWPRPARPASLQARVAAPVLPKEPEAAPTTGVAPPVAAPPSTGTPEGGLLATLRSGVEGARLQSVVLDPRSGALDATFRVSETDDAKALALTLGRAALVAAPTATLASLRAVGEDGRLVFSAELARAGMDGEDPLTNVYPPPPSGPSADGATGAAPTTTTGETAPTAVPTPGGP